MPFSHLYSPIKSILYVVHKKKLIILVRAIHSKRDGGTTDQRYGYIVLGIHIFIWGGGGGGGGGVP